MEAEAGYAEASRNGPFWMQIRSPVCSDAVTAKREGDTARCGGRRSTAGHSPNKQGESRISCLTDKAGQENARTIPENAVIVLI